MEQDGGLSENLRADCWGGWAVGEAPVPLGTAGKNVLALSSLAQESLIAFSTFFVAFMVPSGWILANMESYKSRE